MMTFDYQISPASRTRVSQVDLRSASAEALHYDLFLGDVIFKSDDQDFSATWSWVPILDFAMGLLRIVRALRPSGNDRFEFTESEATLDFERQGDQVQISSSYSPAFAIVSYKDLLRAIERFTQRVLQELVAEFPELCDAKAFQVCQREVLSPSGSDRP